MRKRFGSERHEIDSVFVLLLFTLFAGCILMVLLLGARSYEGMVRRDAGDYTARTGVQYIAAKLRHGDEAGCVRVGSYSDMDDREADEIPTLYLRMQVEGEYFDTKIYYYDGYIRELLCPEDLTLDPEAGQKILAATDFRVSQEDALLRVTIADEEGQEHQIHLAIRSSLEVSE